jgi:hypothetical protein
MRSFIALARVWYWLVRRPTISAALHPPPPRRTQPGKILDAAERFIFMYHNTSMYRGGEPCEICIDNKRRGARVHWGTHSLRQVSRRYTRGIKGQLGQMVCA